MSLHLQFASKNGRKALPNEMLDEIIEFLVNFPHMVRKGKDMIKLNSAFSALYAKKARKLMEKLNWSQNWLPICLGRARLAIATRNFNAKKQCQNDGHSPEELLNFNFGDLLLIYGKIENGHFLGGLKDIDPKIRRLRLIPVDFVRLIKQEDEMKILQAKYDAMLGI